MTEESRRPDEADVNAGETDVDAGREEPDEADVDDTREEPEIGFINYESFELILRHRVHDMKNKKVFDIEDPIIVRYSMIHGFGEYMRIPGHLTYILDELFNDLQRTYRQRILAYEHTEGENDESR